MDEYIAAKCNIFWHYGAENLVANAENNVTREIAKNSDLALTYFSSQKTSYSEIVPFFKQGAKAVYEDNGIIYIDNGKDRQEIVRTEDILLAGRHNVENYMSAIALTEGYVSRDTIQTVAKTFKGVEHRLELVREKDGVKFYNSSIDSSPTRTAAALSALSKKPVIICGGSEKGVAFDTLALDLCAKTKAVILTGDAAENILKAIENCPDYDKAKLPVYHVPDFDEAVKKAASLASTGDIVLLSGACASFDRFIDFAHRGNYFKKLVNELE
jgi:UDP-N-acetylmuramoylalanine--D-glutamate ligase